MAKVYGRFLLEEYLARKINFEKEKYNLVSIVIGSEEVCRSCNMEMYVHWQNMIDTIGEFDNMCTDGTTLLHYFVDYYTIKETEDSKILVLYLGQYWNGTD